MDTKEAGRLGGLSRSPAKQRASRENGKRNRERAAKQNDFPIVPPVAPTETLPIPVFNSRKENQS